MLDLSARIAANLNAICSRIAEAAQRAGRPTADVQLVAVTKYAEPNWVEALVDLGHRHLGESRPQQLAERAEALTGAITWHLIGHLQRNKVRAVLPHVGLIHSVDSLRLARRISEIAGELSLTSRILLEVNVSGEAAKDGFDPQILRTEWQQLCELPHLDVAGLMTMAPDSDDAESARPTFRALSELRDELETTSPDGRKLTDLSMGMSGDFEVAIEEGATLVRVGSALFDGLRS